MIAQKESRKINNVKLGVFFSYTLIILNSIYGLVITPYILGILGTVEFGVYKTIASLSSSLMVLDLGIGGTATRYIAQYIADKKSEKEPLFISMILGEALIIIIFIVAVCVGIFFCIPIIYKTGLDSEQMALAKTLFVILAFNMCLHVAENVMNGIISGHNRFIVGNGLKLVRMILRIGLTFLILNVVRSSIVLVTIDLVLTVALLIAEIYYVKKELEVPIKVSFGNWDKKLFRESFRYTGLLFLTSIAAQVNSNLDNVVIGAELGASYVAVYSMALIVFAMFENLSTAISGVMLPTITNSLSVDPSGKDAMNLVIAAGRIQFIILGATLGGFIVLGKDFINLWLGESYRDAYVVALLLMVPSLLELCVNVCLSILRAKNKLVFRTAVIFIMTILNALITVLGVKVYGYYAAAIGTGISFLIGSVLIMNIYYYKTLQFNMIKVYIKIFSKSWICILLSVISSMFVSWHINGTWLNLVINIMVFCLVYFGSLMLFGFNKNEKIQIESIMRRIYKWSM